MAYTFEQSYYFRPYRGNSSFWLNRYGNGASHLTRKLHCIRAQVLLISVLKFTRSAVVASCFLTSTMRMV